MLSNEELETELIKVRGLLKGWPGIDGFCAPTPRLAFSYVNGPLEPPLTVSLLNGHGVFTREQVFPEAPPLGLKPRKIHDEQRAADIQQAIIRYISAKKPIPSEWYVELCELSPPATFDNFDLWHPIWDLLLQRELSFK